MKHAVTALLLALVAAPALADEVWTTRVGEVVYDSNTPDGTAIFTAPAIMFEPGAPKGAVARIYIPFLDEVPDSRYLHTGFWIVEGGTTCLASLTGPDGVTSADWGFVELYFDQPTFPSGFTMTWGLCEYEKFDFIRAEPIVGE